MRRAFDRWARSVGDDPDPRFTLANERTFLSWVTASLGFLGIGLAMGTLFPDPSPWTTVLAALWILLAAVTNVRSVVRWFRMERAMRRSEGLPLSSSIPYVAVSVGLLGLASGIDVLVHG
jgi:inner membrane protein YidH